MLNPQAGPGSPEILRADAEAFAATTRSPAAATPAATGEQAALAPAVLQPEDARPAARERDAVYRRLLAVADALAAATALLVSILAVSDDGRVGLATLATVPLIVVISKLIGNYDREELLVGKSTLDEAPALFQLAALYALSVWIILRPLITQARPPRELLLLWILLFLLLLLSRAAARALSRAFTPAERCLVIGDAASCERITRKFQRWRAAHATVVAQVTDDAPLGNAEDLRALVSWLGVDRLIVAPGSADHHGGVSVVYSATALGLKVSVLPRVLEVVGSSVEFDDVEGLPLLSMRTLGLSRSSRLVKRIVDVFGSALGLVLLSLLLAVIAMSIKLDSPGPVLFRQRRVGRDGTAFEMLKFRTMVVGAHERRHELRHLNQADGLFKIEHDPRFTRVGKLLRRMSLDELPQLVNVLRGDMSLVGPRPLIPEEDSRIEGWYRRRLQLTPGMTGHWQVLGSSRIPLDEMVTIDYLYVTNWSLWLDVKILLRTIPYMLSRSGL